MKKSEIKKLVRETLREKTNPSSAVKNAIKAQDQAKNVGIANKNVKKLSDFALTFQTWFSSLGYEPGSITIQQIRTEVEAALKELGYK